jgi:6,7-dimethyl-8-ribityllumazine synthase
VSEHPGTELLGPVDAAGLKVGVVVAAYNREITEGLLAGAQAVLGDADVEVVWVSGAFELPVAAQALISGGCEAIVALGAVVAGETDHYEHLARESIRGLQDVMLQTGVPIGLGVLTVRDILHAKERSIPGPNNKGSEAAEAAVRTARLLKELGS